MTHIPSHYIYLFIYTVCKKMYQLIESIIYVVCLKLLHLLRSVFTQLSLASSKKKKKERKRIPRSTLTFSYREISFVISVTLRYPFPYYPLLRFSQTVALRSTAEAPRPSRSLFRGML